MASQPRPWRRLPSMIRGPAPAMGPPPATPAAPAPTPPVTRPMAPMATFRSASPPPPPESQPEPQAQRESTPPPAPPPAGAPPSEPGTPQTRGANIGSVPSTPVSRPVGPSQVQGSTSTLAPSSPAPAPRTSPPAVASPPVPAPRISSPPSFFSPRLSSRVSAPNSPVQTQNRVPSPSPPSPPPPPRAPSPAIAPTAMPVPSPKMESKRVITPVPSPTKVVKPEAESRTPPQSPKTRPMAPPPSPLSLPPTQIKTMEAEQKKVLMHEKVPSPGHNNHTGGGAEMHRESAGENHKHDLRHGHGHGNGPGKGIMDAHKKHQHHEKKHSEEEAGVKVITLAGENKGAVMNLLRSPKTGRFLHGRGNMTDGNESGSSSSSGGEGRHKIKDKAHKQNAGMSPPMTAFMNSNVQGVNNSIVFNSSCTHHDPGVHLSFSRKPMPHGIHHHHNQTKDKDGTNAKGH